MLKKQMAVLLAVIFAAALFSAEKYAVLITGDYAAEEVPVEMRWQTYQSDESARPGAMECFWNDTYLMWEMLIEMGYKDENIHVLFANGVDYSITNQAIADEYDPQFYMKDDKYKMTDYPATRGNIDIVVDELNSKITDDDFLFVWTFDHGGYEGIEEDYEAGLPVVPESEEVPSYLVLLNDDFSDYDKIWDYEFAGYFNPMPANKKVYWMQQCFSGGFKYEMTHDISDDTIPFGEHPELDNVFFNSASNWENVAKIADDYVVVYAPEYTYVWHDTDCENEKINEKKYMHGEFNFHQICATKQEKPDGNEYYYYEVDHGSTAYSVHYSEVDGISSDLYNVHADNVITIKETQIWDSLFQTDAGNRDRMPDYTDFGGIGYHTALNYPTVIHDEFDNPLSYVFEPIKGEVYIIKDINVKNGTLSFAPNSHISMFDNATITVDSKVLLDYNSTLTGGLNNTMLLTPRSSLELNGANISNVDILPYSGLYEVDVYSTTALENSQLDVSSIRENTVSTLNLFNASAFTVRNSTITMGEKSILTMHDNSTMYVDESDLILEAGSKFQVDGNARIVGDVQLADSVNIDIAENAVLNLQLGFISIKPNTTLKLGRNSKLVIENGSDFTIADGAVVELAEGAEIIVMNKGNLISSGGNFSYIGEIGTKWFGINAMTGSLIDLDNVSIYDAETGVKGSGNYQFDITNSTFDGCINGIDLAGMTSDPESETEPLYQFTIMDNILTGIEDGRGITITQSDGVFKNNSISYFGTGVSLILCSPEIVKNEISYNKYFGITISGQDAMPELVDYNSTNQISKLNNVIEKNGYEIHGSLYPSGNIGLRPYSNVYMRYNDVISSPRLYGISIAQLSPMGNNILIDARSNYWGSGVVTDDYFFGHVDYTIDYTPYFSSSCADLISEDEMTAESALLTNAAQLEIKGNYKAANKLYEILIKRHENTPEYYVTMTRLPHLYSKAGWDQGKLLKIYDEAYESEGTTHKKFFKGAKVTANIKGRKYDDAITIAEQMKAEADFEEEIILADINIAIANMLKNSRGKGKSETQADDVRGLISKLTGDADNNEPSDIAESVLPSQNMLYQNYPNPFNPVTQIKFALAKTADVKFSVYNISGQKVAELANGSKQAGIHTVEFDGSKFNSGIYYYTLEVDGKNITKKMVLTK